MLERPCYRVMQIVIILVRILARAVSVFAVYASICRLCARYIFVDRFALFLCPLTRLSFDLIYALLIYHYLTVVLEKFNR